MHQESRRWASQGWGPPGGGPPPGGGGGWGPPPGAPPGGGGGGWGPPGGPPGGGGGGYGPPPGGGGGGYGPPPGGGGGGYGPPGGGGYGPPPGAPPGGYGAPPGAPPGGYGAPPGPGGFGGPPGFGGGYAPAQQGGGFGAQAKPLPGAGMRFQYAGTGGELLGEAFVGLLLTMITFGIYAPWFYCRMLRYFSSKTTGGPTAHGQLRVEFNGDGGSLFGVIFVGALLTMITFGIYGAWFACRLTQYLCDNTAVVGQDGTRYQVQFRGQGGDLFGKMIVGYLLTMITFGIYMPWFLCQMRKWFYDQSTIVANGQQAGRLEFFGEGGELFGTFLLGMFLTIITCGIYKSWFDVTLAQYWARHTRIQLNGQQYAMDFDGDGAELFVLNLVGRLLTMLTLGIYSAWWVTNVVKFDVEHYVYRRLG
ncbi:MAG: DUF898 family protein [Polyangiaceae bacterium]